MRHAQILLAIGLSFLTFLSAGCNTTTESSSRFTKPTLAHTPISDFSVFKQHREREDMMLSRLRVNNRDIAAQFELAKVRESLGYFRQARNGYRNLIKATAAATPENERMKQYAAQRLAVLRAGIQDNRVLAINSRHFQ